MHSILNDALGPMDSVQFIPPRVNNIKVLDGKGLEARVHQIIECCEAGASVDSREHLLAT